MTSSALERDILPDDSPSRNDLHRTTPIPVHNVDTSSGAAPRTATDLPRAASYSNIPSLSDADAGFLTFSEEDLIPSTTKWPEDDLDTSTAASGPHYDTVVPSNMLYSTSTDHTSKITLSRIVVSPDVELDELEPLPSKAPSTAHRALHKPRKLTRTLSGLAKKTRDRATSAVATGQGSAANMSDVSSSLTNSEVSHVLRETTVGHDEFQAASSLARKLNPLNKMNTRLERSPPKRSFASESRAANSPIPAVHKSYSNISLPSITRNDTASSNALPRPVSAEKFKTLVPFAQKKKDELWSTFQSLDADFQKFQSKSSILKANMVRSSLLPFLRAYASHPSNDQLRSEDLDRRTTTLNKWWTGLLEMLDGRNGQSISGTDRPAILDGIAGIMERSEWRQLGVIVTPWSDQMSLVSDSKYSRGSTASDASDPIFEAVQRNVHAIFVENLIAQIVLVVEKMSLKSAPASLVTFCGKTCAYAFMFCPGVANVLVHLWEVSTVNLRKVLDGFGLSRIGSYQDVSERIGAAFPPHLRSLSFVSFKQTLQDLQAQPTPPPGTENLQWHGYWKSRWSGKDSDLLYTFVKYYHLLLVNYLPSGTTEKERACVPGLLLVHTQLLTNLESTIHRQWSPSSADTGFDPSLTFDDLLGPDAVPSVLPPPPINATRLMVENRIIMLLRDFLADKMPEHLARRVFAENFSVILTTAVRMTSLYDHNACFTWCDFLQEAFVIMIKYESTTNLQQPLLDSSFWVAVFTRMINSHNTMTEIRLYAFLYTVWGTISNYQSWKHDICLKFLLDEQIFYSRFNHWCPMVRAYFMRLICWRIARLDVEATPGDVFIVETLMARLNLVWSHYNYQLHRSREGEIQQSPPSTLPCNPAPGRRLLIIRTDTPTMASYLSFSLQSRPRQGGRRQNNVLPVPVISSGPNPYQLMQRLSNPPEKVAEPAKKKGGLLRSLMGYRSSDTRNDPQSPQLSSPATSPQSSANSSRNTSPERPNTRTSMYETSASRDLTSKDQPLPNSQSTKPVSAAGEPGNAQTEAANVPAIAPYLGPAFFKFSLEFVDRRGHPSSVNLHPPRLPLVAQLALQALATFQTNVEPKRATGLAEHASRYAGRALAEWQLVVNECQNFSDRRRKEGVPSNRLVETPTLSVEPYRKPS